jgi:predicted RNA-binding protein YlxR (DUF448 family)
MIAVSNPRAASRSERTCVACREKAPPADLVRLVMGDNGRPVPDLARAAHGRGVWVHPTPSCVARAARGGLARSLRAPAATTTASELWEALRLASAEQAMVLLSAGHRSGRLVATSTADGAESELDGAALVIVAADAPDAARADWVETAIREGRAAAWSSRARLGWATGRTETSVVAVLDDELAAALARAIRVAQTLAPSTGSRNVGNDVSTEVR